MTEFVLSLKIEKVGWLEADNALRDLDRNGRKIVEGVSAATGRALGDIAVAYEKGSKIIRNQLQTIADGHYANIKAMEAEQRAAERSVANAEAQTDRLTMRSANSALAASRAIEMIGRTGHESGRALDTLIAQASQVAFSFGAAGPIVGAIGIATAAMIEMFARTSREAKKAADEAAKQFERIAAMSVSAQGEQASVLFNGNPDAADKLDRPGIKGLRAQAAALAEKVAAGTSRQFDPNVGMVTRLSGDAKDAAKELEAVKNKLAEIEPIYKRMMGLSGSISRMGQKEGEENKPGFVTDDIKAAEEAAKKKAKAVAKAWDDAIKEFAKGVDERGNAREKQADAIATQIIENYEMTIGQAIRELVPDVKKMFHDEKFSLSEIIAEQIKNDPILKFQKAVEELAKKVRESLSKTLGDGVVAGFEAAFSGKGIGGAFKSLTATVLSGLGGLMEMLGTQMIVFGGWVAKFVTHVATFDFVGQIEAGVGMIAAGAALKAIAGRFGGNSSSSAGSGGSSAAPSFLSFSVQAPATSTTSSAPPAAKPTNNFTIIGPADPQAQRAIADIVNRASDRNLIPSRA